ncbi:MAG: hypothetical protein ACYTGC_10100 [Planctomycetota bacterium]|jgi:hypothetical protein
MEHVFAPVVAGVLLSTTTCQPAHTMYSPDTYLQKHATGYWVLDRGASIEATAQMPEPASITIQRGPGGSSTSSSPGRHRTPEEIAERRSIVTEIFGTMDFRLEVRADHSLEMSVRSGGSDAPHQATTFEWATTPAIPSRPIYRITTIDEEGRPGPQFVFDGDADLIRHAVPPARMTFVLRREP